MMKKIARRVQQVKRSIFDSDRVVVYHGDCLKVIASMPAASVDTIVTDPPYGLEFMGKDWDKFGRMREYKSRGGTNDKGILPYYGRGGLSKDLAKFHAKAGIAFQLWCTDWARIALRAAKPGAVLLAFGGTRTFHRLASAIEDAGWEVRDCLIWVHGQGFPKSLDVSKAIDKVAGAQRPVIGVSEHGACNKPHGRSFDDDGYEWQRFHNITAPATPEAARWQGWGTGLKPSWEPIILARKPLDGTVAECVLRHGTGALNVDGCRIGGGTGRWPPNAIFQHDARCVLVGTEADPGYAINRFNDGAKPFGGGAGYEYESERVPGGEREVWACVPGCPVRMLDGQGGMRTSGSRKAGVRKGVGYHGADGDGGPAIAGNAGYASRFFYTPKASTTERVLGCPPGYQNRHPTVKPLDLCRWLCRLTKTPDGGVVLDPFSGSGSIAVAALLEGRRVIAIELEEESANATIARVQAALKYGDELQKLKRYKLRGRKKIKRRQQCKQDE